MEKFRWKGFFWSGAEKVHQKLHQFTPGGMWLEMNKTNELLHQFILNHTHIINLLFFGYNGVIFVVDNGVLAAES